MSATKRTTTPSEDEAELLARAAGYRLLARLFADPVEGVFAGEQDIAVARAAAQFQDDEVTVRLLDELAKVLPVGDEAARRSYTDMFGLLVSPEAPPYELEYEQRTDVFWRADRMADIAAFHRAFGLELTVRERHDHISVEAGFLWYLLERMVTAHDRGHGEDKREILRSAFLSYFTEHFGPWILSFERALSAAAEAKRHEFFACAAAFLGNFAATELGRFGLEGVGIRKPAVTESAVAEECDGCGLAGASNE